MLICESGLLKSCGLPEINSHLTAEQTTQIAKQEKVKALKLTHFWPEENIKNYLDEAKKVFNNILLFKEGQVIDIPVIGKEEQSKG